MDWRLKLLINVCLLKLQYIVWHKFSPPLSVSSLSVTLIFGISPGLPALVLLLSQIHCANLYLTPNVSNKSPVCMTVFWCNKTRLVEPNWNLLFNEIRCCLVRVSSSLPVHPSLINTYFIHAQPVTVLKIHKDLGVIIVLERALCVPII